MKFNDSFLTSHANAVRYSQDQSTNLELETLIKEKTQLEKVS